MLEKLVPETFPGKSIETGEFSRMIRIATQELINAGFHFTGM
jgi:hypothetical protein